MGGLLRLTSYCSDAQAWNPNPHHLHGPKRYPLSHSSSLSIHSFHVAETSSEEHRHYGAADPRFALFLHMLQQQKSWILWSCVPLTMMQKVNSLLISQEIYVASTVLLYYIYSL